MSDSIQKDVEELKALRVQARREVVKNILDAKIAELSTQIIISKTEEKPEKPVAELVKTIPSTVGVLPTIKLTTYAWDESEKFIKLYFSLKGIESLKSENIISKIQNRGFEVAVHGLDGKNYEIVFKDLFNEIIPESSSVKQKVGDLLIMLRKKNETKMWGVLTKIAHVEKEKNKPKLEDQMNDKDPQSSLMNMMKQMYDTGDDEMKKNIRKAWHEGQNKKGGAMGMDF